MMDRNAKIYVSGHRGMVGGALVRRLQQDGCQNLVLRTSAELDLRNQQAVADFFAAEQPDYVFLSAAKVGGIAYNIEHPAEMLEDNLAIQNNVLHSAKDNGVKKLLFMGSSCIYPREAPQPMKEEYLLTGPLEPTNEGYALAKIAGLRQCEYYNKQYGTDFISVMPCNVYGTGDHYDLKSSHVLSALVRKFCDAVDTGAERVDVWGTGNAMRELLFVDDLADACLFLMDNYDETPFLNVGTGKDVTIRQLAETIAAITGFSGVLTFDTSKPDGMPRKVLDVSRLAALGWCASIKLEEGIRRTIKDYRARGGTDGR